MPEENFKTGQQELTEEEIVQRLSQLAGSQPTAEEKQNVHTFLNKVVVEEDTTKLGFLDSDELGTPSHPFRT
ncbi:hypothetical protein LCGC14_1453750, partial [marine sediment metagenome]